MSKTKSTEKQLNKLSEFRQAIYQFAFTARRDALFELLDAVLLKGPMPSFPMLSLSLFCQRQWPSLYQAVEEGCIDVAWLRLFLTQQVPGRGIQVFPLDGTAWPRAQARTLPDRQYVYHPTQVVCNGKIAVGYTYSLLDWVPWAGRSWSLSLDLERVPSRQTDVAVGVEQVKRLGQARETLTNVLDIVVADAKYGNHRFFRPLRGQRCGLLTALRSDRVLYRRPSPKEQLPLGRKRKHGRRFAFKEPGTWGKPVETFSFNDSHWGQVTLRRWNDLHEKAAADTPLDVIQACVHLEKVKPPKPFWLAWQAPPTLPPHCIVTALVLWRAYQKRWPIEPSIRFRKQNLMWLTPHFHTPQAGDRWSQVVNLAMWTLYYARPLVADCPFPWQARQTELTPGRVQHGLGELFCKIGSPTTCPQTRGKSPGWPKGKPRQRRPRWPVIKKVRHKPKIALAST